MLEGSHPQQIYARVKDDDPCKVQSRISDMNAYDMLQKSFVLEDHSSIL